MRSTNTPELAALRSRFGDNLVLRRGRSDLSQADVAERSGLHVTEISLLERGYRIPRLDTIVKLAGAIEIEPCELFTGMSWRIDLERESD
ncbi:MAG TPA: helix-turn-helix transcriptional regulator [Solirubrobacterales bacterium]|nr:helix-turn-helix transcriptional regulator [Solirubrobacterales bacterium]